MTGGMTGGKTGGLSLPPLYTPVVIAGTARDARDVAEGLARDGAEAGTFVFVDRADRLDCAIVLCPDDTLAASRPAAIAAVLALSDALGAVCPAGVECDLAWPGGIRVNGGIVGGIGLSAAEAAGEDDVPAWMVAAAILHIAPGPAPAADEAAGRAWLALEGCAGAAPRDLAESFARHFLKWTDLWLESGLAPLARHWVHRATLNAPDTVVSVAGDLVAGTILGLDDSGGLILDAGGKRRVIGLGPRVESVPDAQ